jgi:hypothetical protein
MKNKQADSIMTKFARFGLYAFLLLFALAVAVPNFVRARVRPCANACINNLRQIDGAKEQWALENKKPAGTPVDKAAEQEINRYIKGGPPKCPGGGTYTYNPVDTPPSCDLKDPFGQAHTLAPMPAQPAAPSNPVKK